MNTLFCPDTIRNFSPTTLISGGCRLGPRIMATMLTLMGLVPASAATLVESSASTGVTSGNDPHSQSSGTVSSQNSGSFANFSGASHSQASFGVLRVYSEAHAATTNGGSGVSAGSNASFTDDFTVNAADKTGQAGTITIKVGVHGTLSGGLRTPGSEQFSAQSRTSATLTVTKDRLLDSRITYSHHTRFTAYDGVTAVTGEPFMNRVVTFSFPIVFGKPFELGVFLQSGTFVLEKFGADCIGDLSNTGEWQGIASVTDGGGNPVAGYTVTSGTGTDYTRPIRYEPEITEFSINAGIPRVSFTTLAGRSYTVQSTPSLANPTWLPLTNATSLIGTGAIHHVEEPASETATPPARFYRVGLQP